MGLAILEATGQLCVKAASKKATQKMKVIMMSFAVLAYMTTLFLSYLTYITYGIGLGKINLIWASMAIILSILYGRIMFGEIIGLRMVLAIVFALLAIIFAHSG